MTSISWEKRFEAAMEHARGVTQKLIQQNTSAHEKFQDDWPNTIGTVESTNSEIVAADRYGSVFVAELSYSYCVNGEYYAGFYRVAAGTEAEAGAILRGWKGRRVTVRYSPENNAVSVMLPYQPLPRE
jgi:hypothetical protein